MSEILKILKQDLSASYKAFLKDDFELANTYANRLMANSIFQDNYKLFLPGLFAKEIALNLDKNKKKADFPLETAKLKAKKLFEFLINNYSEDLDELKFWEAYFDYFKSYSKLIILEIEKEVYIENTKFTKNCFSYLLKLLNENREVIFEISNGLFLNLVNEMTRILVTHSGEIKEFLIYTYLIYLTRLYDEFCIINIENNVLKKEPIKEKFFPLMDYITKEFQESSLKISIFNKKLNQIVKDWRIYYLFSTRFKSHPILIKDKEKPNDEKKPKIELSSEMKKVLVEGITETLEKKLK